VGGKGENWGEMIGGGGPQRCKKKMGVAGRGSTHKDLGTSENK